MDIEEVKRSSASPMKVWDSWVQSHLVHGAAKLENGTSGKVSKSNKKAFSYQVTNVVFAKSFSTVWKVFLLKLVFHHSVTATNRGSEIRYGFDLKGPLAWILRPFLLSKIRYHLVSSLETFVNQLERR